MRVALLTLLPTALVVACVSAPPGPVAQTAVTTVSSAPAATSSLASASPSGPALSSPGESAPVAGITAGALGALNGSWTFFTRSVLIPPSVTARLEVWGIPLGAAPRLAFSYSVPLGGVPEAPLDNSPYLRRQFSPDGQQIVVSTTAGLAVVDLPSGRVRRIGADGQFPSWSKDGSTIAYLATVANPDPQLATPERAIWVVPSAGGTPRELVGVGYSTISPEWSSDSSLLMAQLRDGVGLIDVAGAREIPGGRIPFALSTTGAHWPASRSQVAITLIRRDDTQLVMYDRATGITSFLAQFPRPYDASSCQCPQGNVPKDPRWSPAGTDEVLYVLLDEKAGHAEVDILDTQSGRLSKLPLDAAEATWSADGTAVVYIARRQGTGGGSLRMYDRATRADRELVAVPGAASQLSVVSVTY